MLEQRKDAANETASSRECLLLDYVRRLNATKSRRLSIIPATLPTNRRRKFRVAEFRYPRPSRLPFRRA